jgi:hypothetical protein
VSQCRGGLAPAASLCVLAQVISGRECLRLAPGVQMHDLLTINLSGPGTIDHVINDTGGPVSSANRDVASQVVSYPPGG